MSAIKSQMELKRCTYDSTLSLGKKLRENPKTGQVTSVKDAMSDLEMTWSDFELALKDCSEQVKRLRILPCNAHSDCCDFANPLSETRLII